MRIRTVIVDDEELARERLRSLLSKESELEVIGEAADGRSALDLIQEHKPELVFLDVQMPELNGFDVLEALDEEQRPEVVFVTAYDQFALRAFEVHAVDYLLKPFDRERFQIALRRALDKIQSATSSSDSVKAALKDIRTQGRSVERLLVKSEGRVVVLKVDEIDWIEAADNYVILHTGSEKHMMRNTMSSLEARLSPDKFMRISRSAIVNIDRIKELQPMFHGDYVVVLKNGAKVTLSRTYRHQVEKLGGSSEA